MTQGAGSCVCQPKWPGVTAFLPAGNPGRIYRANGAASQFPDDPGLWPPLRRAMISTSTPIPLPRFPVRRLKVGAGDGGASFGVQATRSTAQLAPLASSEVLPDFPPRRPAPDYGPRPQPLARATASALLRGPAAPAQPVTFKRFILTKPCRALRPSQLRVSHLWQRSARGRFLPGAAAVSWVI